MFGITRKKGRLSLAVLAGLGFAGLASHQVRANVVYSTDFTSTPTTFTSGDSWTNGGTTDGLQGYISGTASAKIAVTPTGASAYNTNAYNSPSPGASTASGASWQGAPNLNTQSLQLVRSDGGASGVSPNLSSLTVNSASQNNTVTVSTYVGSVPASGSGTGPFVGLALYGNAGDAVPIGAFGINESTGQVIYSLDGTNYSLTGISEAPIASNGEYDQLQLVAAFTGGNGSVAGSIKLTGYVDGALAFSGTSAAVGDVSSLNHAYMFDGEFGASDTNSPYTAYFGDYEVSQNLSAVPEPASLALFGVCGMMLAARRSRRSAAL